MLPLIQSHNILDYYQQKTSANLNDFLNAAVDEDKRTLFWSGLSDSYHSLFSIALSAFLAIPISGNSIANLVFFTAIANLVMEQSSIAEKLFQQIVKSHISFCHVDELENLPKRQGNVTLKSIDSISFNEVTFVYPNGTCGLHNVSYNLQKGDTVRLSGPNGSGKSTFIKLLTGIYQPSSGNILLNNKPLKDYTRQSINEQILYIGQDEKCLNESVHDYLELVSHCSVSDEKYQELLDYVHLENDCKIEGNGDSLSPGQRKKLLILKLLLGFESASLIIVDELTTGLDAETTSKAYELLCRISDSGDKILIIVDHNLSGQVSISKAIEFKDNL